MGTPVITVDNISKQYKIGLRERSEKTFRDAIADTFTAPFRRFRALGEQSTDDDLFWALKDVSFEVQPGEIVGIIGRNGAGKSTLLKILSRITEPTTGRAVIRGRVGSLLEVGTGFHPELTGRENILLNGAILGMKKAEIDRKFDGIVAFAEIEKFLDTPVKRYSSGMYVRLAFAVAAHLEPEILLVDEVLAVGDMAFQQKCLGKMDNVAREGRTVLFVSHNMPAIEALCKKAMLIQSGRLAAVGDTSSIVRRYVSDMVATARNALASGGTKNIRSVVIKNRDGVETDRFLVGEDIIFDIELYHEPRLDTPRVSIGLHNARGERLVTIHTDIQQNRRWSVEGRRWVRAIWKNNRMVPYRYRVDVSLWGQANEIEYLPGCRTLEILPRDVYGTGMLPDPNGQGYLLPDAHWDLNRD